MSGLRTFTKYLILTGGVSLFLSACSQRVLIKDYQLSPENKGISSLSFEKLPLKELLKTTIDNVVASNILDSDYEQELTGRTYGVSTKGLSRRIAAFYSPKSEYIHLFIDKNAKSADYLDEQQFLEFYFFHEEAHRFWDKKLSKDQQDTFREEILGIQNEYLMLLNESTKENKPIDDNLLLEHGFTPETFAIFTHFMSKEEFYTEYYGEHFTERFFGTEAFAYMFGEQASYFMSNKRISNHSHEPEDLIDLRIKENSENALRKTEYIPRNMHHYFKGLLNNKFLENNQ